MLLRNTGCASFFINSDHVEFDSLKMGESSNWKQNGTKYSMYFQLDEHGCSAIPTFRYIFNV